MGEWEWGVSDKGPEMLMPPAFSRLHLALTVIQNQGPQSQSQTC